MHTVELLLDAAAEDGVRELWSRLAAAGLPSLATHRHPTNRPHLTLVSAPSLAGLDLPALPIAAELGAARMLGRALVREVTFPAEAQARVWRSVGGWPPPQNFVPHVSLALRGHEFPPGWLSDLPPMPVSFPAARTYDTDTRTVTGLRGPG